MLNYVRYMMDSLKEYDPVEYERLNLQDEDEYLYEEGEETSSVYKLNYYFRDHLQLPLVSSQLAKARVKDGLIELTGDYMDKHAKALSAAGPVYQMTFGAAETKVLYDLFGVTAEILVDMYNEVVKETYNGSISKFITGWVNNAPHKLLLIAILVDAIQNDYQDIIECVEYLWAFSEYPMLYKEFWKTGVKEDVMNYTIEHLGNKFKIKKMNNLQELLKYDATKPIQAYTEKLRSGYDHVYIDILYRLRNQFRSTLRKIANEYYKNDAENATQHNNQAVFDDGQIADSEGITANIGQIVDRVLNKFAAKEINSSMVGIAAEANHVDKGNVKNFIAQIYAVKNNKLPVLVEDIIISYFKKFPGNSSLITQEFISFGLSLYKTIAASGDHTHQEIKTILDQWIYGIIDIRSMYNREPTIIDYRKAIYHYIVLMIAVYGS